PTSTNSTIAPWSQSQVGDTPRTLPAPACPLARPRAAGAARAAAAAGAECDRQPLGRVGEEAWCRDLVADRPNRGRVLREQQLARRAIALVVENHLHALVRVDEVEELIDEAGAVALPHRPLGEHERLAGELVVEPLQPGEVREGAVEI